MWRLFAMIFVSVSFAFSASANQNSSPREFIVSVFEAFNAEDARRYTAMFATPHVRMINGSLVIQETDEPFIDFDMLKQSGWKTTMVNAIDVLDQSPSAAIVQVTFSRRDETGTPYLETTGFYTLSKEGGDWHIIAIASAGSVPINRNEK
ncbi:MAG: hypothetical protein AAGB02_03650 [Pseudomonadota bacterium]